MKPIFKLVTLACFIAFTFSCTLQKRVYNKGYYISFKKKAHSAPQLPTQNNANTPVLLAGSSNNLEVIAEKLIPLPPDSCGDLIYFKDGSVLKSKVLKDSLKYIRYSFCDKLNQSTLVHKEEISGIVYLDPAKVYIPLIEKGKKQKVFKYKSNKELLNAPEFSFLKKAVNSTKLFLLITLLGAASFFLIGPGILTGMLAIAAIVANIVSMVLAAKAYTKIDNDYSLEEGRKIAKINFIVAYFALVSYTIVIGLITLLVMFVFALYSI